MAPAVQAVVVVPMLWTPLLMLATVAAFSPLPLRVDQDGVHVVHHLVVLVILDDLAEERDVPVLLVQHGVVGGILCQGEHVRIFLHHLVLVLVLILPVAAATRRSLRCCLFVQRRTTIPNLFLQNEKKMGIS